MHKRNPIVNLHLLIGGVLSVALHGAALYSKSIYVPPEPRMESGRTVLQLTLIPSVPSEAATLATAAGSEPPPAIVPQPVESLQLAEASLTEAQPMAEKDSVDSAAQDSSLIEDKGVISEAFASSTIHPAYPRVSRQRGEEGMVILSIQVKASGRAGKIAVLQSSGHRRLDEAACTAARRASFSPARQFGRNIDSTIELPFTFRLTDD